MSYFPVGERHRRQPLGLCRQDGSSSSLHSNAKSIANIVGFVCVCMEFVLDSAGEHAPGKRKFVKRVFICILPDRESEREV